MFAVTTERHPGLVDRLVEHVFEAVFQGRIKHGSKVTESEIAEDFGVSRTPVREAVKRLAEMGVLVVRPRCGLEVVSFNEQDLREIMQLRVELECLALRLAMQRMGHGEIAALERAVEACERKMESGNRIEIFRADSRFHLAIADFSGNRHLLETLRQLNVKVQLCRMIFCTSMSKIANDVRFHRDVLDAIRGRRAVLAEELLRIHIVGAFEGLDAGCAK